MVGQVNTLRYTMYCTPHTHYSTAQRATDGAIVISLRISSRIEPTSRRQVINVTQVGPALTWHGRRFSSGLFHGLFSNELLAGNQNQL